jgi:hypothetical protein
MSVLTEKIILEVYKAAVAMHLADSRAVLLTGIRSDFVATLPSATNPAAQTLSDLRMLNEIESLDDGTVPLLTWLLNALALAGPREEAWILEFALKQVGDPPTLVLAVAKALERSQPSWGRQSRDKTERLAVYFESIARCLVDLEDHFRMESDRGGFIGKCSELSVYARHFLDAVGNTLSESEAHALASALQGACSYRAFLVAFADEPAANRAAALDGLAEAAGSFRGLAVTLRV